MRKKSKNEKTFGTRLKRGQDYLAALLSFDNYNPPIAELSIQALDQLIQDIIAVTKDLSAAEETTHQAQQDRKMAFREGPNSLQIFLTDIKDTVLFNYGPTSKYYRSISMLVNNMRPKKRLDEDEEEEQTDENPTEASDNNDPQDNPDQAMAPTPPTIPTPSPEIPKKSKSRNQSSYASQLNKFRQLVAAVSQYPNYTSSSNDLSLAGLESRLQYLQQLNQDVAKGEIDIEQARGNRDNLYYTLDETLLRIKAFVRNRYRSNSTEYAIIKAL